MSSWLERETWASLIRPVSASFAQSTLLQYAAPVMVFVLCLYAVAALEQENAEAEIRYGQLLRQEASHRSLESQADWSVVVDREVRRVAALDEFMWHAQSLELASADLQSALRSMARDRVVGARIELDDPVPIDDAGRWMIRASITGRLQVDQVVAFLASVDDADKPLYAERFNYFPNRGRSVDLQVVALVRLGNGDGL